MVFCWCLSRALVWDIGSFGLCVFLFSFGGLLIVSVFRFSVCVLDLCGLGLCELFLLSLLSFAFCALLLICLCWACGLLASVCGSSRSVALLFLLSCFSLCWCFFAVVFFVCVVVLSSLMRPFYFFLFCWFFFFFVCSCWFCGCSCLWRVSGVCCVFAVMSLGVFCF